MPEPLADEQFSARVVERSLAYPGAVWDVVKDRFAFGDGELVREYQQHPGAVAVFAEDDDGRVLVIKQYRHPIRYRDWELPAGLLDIEGEGRLEAAKRELAEEADLQASVWEPLCEFFSSPGGSSELISIFRATSLSATDQPFERSAEESEIEVRWVRFSELLAGVLEGRLRNSVLTNAVLNAHARR